MDLYIPRKWYAPFPTTALMLFLTEKPTSMLPIRFHICFITLFIMCVYVAFYTAVAVMESISLTATRALRPYEQWLLPVDGRCNVVEIVLLCALRTFLEAFLRWG